MAAERHNAGSDKTGSSSLTLPRRHGVSLEGSGQQVELVQRGQGSPVFYLHGLLGCERDPLVAELAKRHHVVAPLIPGYGSSTGGEELADMHDLVIYYLEILDRLDLRGLPLVGHSLGGMFAAELAAAAPERFSHLVLLAPFGLWDDSEPTFDFFAASPQEQARAFYSDVNSEGALALAKAPVEAATEVDPDTIEGRAVIEHLVERAKTMMSAARFLWPIPNRGLNRRLFRLTMPTLVIWGANDGVIPASYASRFAEAIRDCKMVVVPGVSHMLPEEKPHDVARGILTFIDPRQTRV